MNGVAHCIRIVRCFLFITQSVSPRKKNRQISIIIPVVESLRVLNWVFFTNKIRSPRRTQEKSANPPSWFVEQEQAYICNFYVKTPCGQIAVIVIGIYLILCFHFETLKIIWHLSFAFSGDEGQMFVSLIEPCFVLINLFWFEIIPIETFVCKEAITNE